MIIGDTQGMWTLIGIGLLLLGSAVILWGVNRGNVRARLAGSAIAVAGFGVIILWGEGSYGIS